MQYTLLAAEGTRIGSCQEAQLERATASGRYYFSFLLSSSHCSRVEFLVYWLIWQTGEREFPTSKHFLCERVLLMQLAKQFFFLNCYFLIYFFCNCLQNNNHSPDSPLVKMHDLVCVKQSGFDSVHVLTRQHSNNFAVTRSTHILIAHFKLIHKNK